MRQLLGLILLMLVGVSNANVITFDDLYTGSFNDQLPADGYAGFNWGRTGVIRDDHQPGSGYEYGTVSGKYTAFNYENTQFNWEFLGEGTFEFVGGYFTSAWVDQDIFFEGYSDGELIHTSSVYQLTTTAPLWIGLDWSGIDQLVITKSAIHLVMDDLTYNVVPIPAAVWLFGSALAGLGWLRRKQTV
jgi:hypothetical protein